MSAVKEERDPNFGGKEPPKPEINKSSMEILSELFSTFDAEPPVIVKKEKKEKDSEAKKSKKSKKKHKHKEKKHKKKSKRKRSSSTSSSGSSNGEVDLAQLLIKQEKDKADEKIKIEGTSLSLDIKLEINKEEQKVKSKSDKDSKQKIHIKDIHLSSIKREKSKKNKTEEEDGEVTDSESDSTRKRKIKHKDKKEKSKRHRSHSRSRSRDKYSKHEDREEKSKKDYVSSDYRSRHDSHSRDFYQSDRKHRERSRSRDNFYSGSYKDDYRSDRRNRYRQRSPSPFRDDDFYRSRPRDRFWQNRDHDSYKRPDHKRDRSKEDNSSSRIDKKKLLEIARRNAVQMMKSGSLPGALSLGSVAQEKMIAAIKSGGKTIEELTDFCKSLSKKEELGELSSLSEQDESDTEEAFHHPFKLKEKPTSITMNITNSVPLPTKSAQERTTELRMQFPVSSGQQHRVNEEWIPVSTQPSKPATAATKPKITQTVSAPLAIEAPPSLPPEAAPNLQVALPGPQVFPPHTETQPANVDISSIVSERLTAMRKLQENPHDVQALGQMYKSNKEMESWAKSKQQLGTFTGSTGVQMLTQAELSSGYQAWAKRDQLQTAAPLSGGMGMHLLQKMGWKPGEGLGKEKTGTLEPLLLEVKLDKKGLVSNEEQPKGKKKAKQAQTVKSLQGKHPVSLLGEYASKRKLGAPQYVLDFECGPDHKKNFLFKVILDGVEYKPNVASANKKEAKANAASLALKQIGLLV